MQLMVANAVVVARSFNPTIFSPFWLARQQVITEETVRPGSVYMEMMSQIATNDFDLLVVPDRLQLSPRQEVVGQDLEREAAIVFGTIERIVRALPETPYAAVGMNFVWHEIPEGETMSQYSRRLFFDDRSPIFRAFSDPDARFGAYMSKDVEPGTRLKFDIKPIHILNNITGEEQDRLQMSFNFHTELGEGDRVEQVLTIIRRWEASRRMAHELAETTIRGGVE